MKKKLLIYVPTYQGESRINYFVQRFTAECAGIEDLIDLHISDNCTPGIDFGHHCSKNIFWSQQIENLGAARNVNNVFNLNQDYEFTWVLGDDDFLTSGSLSRVINLINHRADFFFLNTVTYSSSKKNYVIQLFDSDKKLPVEGAVVKSRLTNKEPFVTEFCNLINPIIDDVLLGSIMCGLFRTSAVKDFSTSNFLETTQHDVFSSYPHVINYANSFKPSSPAIFDPFIYTFNFWDGGNSWKEQYDIVVCLGLLYCIMNYYSNDHLAFSKERHIFQHYLAIAKSSIDNLSRCEDPKILSQFSVVAPYFFDRVSKFGITKE